MFEQLDPLFLSAILPLAIVNSLVAICFVTYMFVSRREPVNKEILERHTSIILNQWIRRFWYWLTDPLFKFFMYFKVSPNTITFIGFLLSVCSAVAFVCHKIGSGGWLMAIGASLDMFDGRVARATGRVTKSGSFFDACLDRISEGILFSTLAWLYRDHWGMVVVLVAYLGAVMTSYAKARGDSLNVNYNGGIMQRPERLAYMSAGAILTPLVAYGWVWWHGDINRAILLETERQVYLVILIWVAILGHITSFDRMRTVMKRLS